MCSFSLPDSVRARGAMGLIWAIFFQAVRDGEPAENLVELAESLSLKIDTNTIKKQRAVSVHQDANSGEYVSVFEGPRPNRSKELTNTRL